jgi:RND family efflux transporter MFP subunit
MQIERQFCLPQRNILLSAILCVLMLDVRPVQAATGPDAPASVQAETIPAHHAPLAQTVRAYGVAAMGPSEMTDVNLPFAVRIAHLHVSAGQRVKRGEVLADAVPDPAAALAYQQSLGAVALAKGELARTDQLFQQQLATQSQLALANKALADANAALAAQQQSGAPTFGSRRIVAPFDGVVIALTAAQGVLLPPGGPIMQLVHVHSGAGTSPLNVALAVNPGDSSRMHAGTAIKLRALNMPASSATINATVISVGGAIDQQTQSVNVVAAVAGGAAGILPGTKVVADIAVSQDPHWIVPRSVVLHDEKGDYLFQVDAGHALRVAVNIAVDNGALLGVDGPLKPALPVVSVGNYELQPGMSVRGPGGAAR